jgi:hypothetical protein
VATVVTVAGLAALLHPLGIEGAAITSSTAYTTAFLVCLRYLSSVGGVPIRSFFGWRSFVDDLRLVAGALGQRVRPARA